MLEAKREEFWNLIARDAKITQVATGLEFTEGPVFSRRGYLLFSDIPKQRIHKWERGTLSVLRENSNRANGLTFDHQGRLLICEGGGRVVRIEKNGATTVLADGLQGPNDLVYAIDGSIYFSDLPAGKVYQITRERAGVGGAPPRGEVRVVASDCAAPNGVALSPDQSLLYVVDSKKQLVRVYGIEPDGRLNGGRDFFAPLRCDGLKTDEGGNVWVASHGAVEVFNAGGQALGSIRMPEEPSNVAFSGGALYMTAQKSVYQIGTKVSGTRTF
jgi:gluconolactonase